MIQRSRLIQSETSASSEGGFIMLTALVMAFILSTLGMIAAQTLISNSRFTQYEVRSAQAMDVAEAGINYYLWHLAHFKV
jgi:Tfp pilus assembly protein PilX